MEQIMEVMFVIIFIVFAYLFFNPVVWFKTRKLCKEEGHLLRINSNGFRVPRHGLTHCVRCAVYLGIEKYDCFGKEIKIKGWEDYSHQWNTF